ncbi:MAG: EAL domain-containing protein [Oscillatoriales cyanobacterium SM2_2_1]|nr:EAL domain-containing protein [Oscillatoriales cyanobacterium SM2_2_1]
MNCETSIRGCNRCEVLPNKLPMQGDLYLWFPIGHTFNKAVTRLQELSLTMTVVAADARVMISYLESNIQPMFAILGEILTDTELQDTRSLITQPNCSPSFADLPCVMSLRRLLALFNSQWLLDLLAEQRITSHFQPIVSVEHPERIFAYEALMRGVDGANLVPPFRLLTAAKSAGVLFHLDLAARQSAIRQMSHHGFPEKLFINFTPTSIYDPSFCLSSTVRVIDALGVAHEKIVFEITESEQVQDLARLQEILTFYRRAGFQVALDDIGSGYSSLNLLHQLRPDYVKLDMELTRHVYDDTYKATITSKILEITQELGIATVAEGIETVEEWHWFRRAGATFVQGYLFGKPADQPQRAIALSVQ